MVNFCRNPERPRQQEKCTKTPVSRRFGSSFLAPANAQLVAVGAAQPMSDLRFGSLPLARSPTTGLTFVEVSGAGETRNALSLGLFFEGLVSEVPVQ